MIAVDTDVVVRFLVNDDRDQALRAKKLFASSDVFLSKTVLLESEWVLRRLYGAQPSGINRAFVELLGMPRVSVEAPRQVRLALDCFSLGLDFADALHLASGNEADRFATFDRKMAKRARQLWSLPVDVL